MAPALLPPPSLPARDHSARDLALSPLHLELSRRRGAAGRARARHLLTTRTALGAEVRFHDDGCVGVALGRAIAGISTRLWCGSPASGCICGVPLITSEVLDMQVQSRRDTRAAQRLMRKRLKKHNRGRIRIRQSDDASASCSGSSRLDPPSAS